MRAKCYIIACALCREFTEVSRRGVLTCSSRCRTGRAVKHTRRVLGCSSGALP